MEIAVKLLTSIHAEHELATDDDRLNGSGCLSAFAKMQSLVITEMASIEVSFPRHDIVFTVKFALMNRELSVARNSQRVHIYHVRNAVRYGIAQFPSTGVTLQNDNRSRFAAGNVDIFPTFVHRDSGSCTNKIIAHRAVEKGRIKGRNEAIFQVVQNHCFVSPRYHVSVLPIWRQCEGAQRVTVT
jgi:hypothetical protein